MLGNDSPGIVSIDSLNDNVLSYMLFNIVTNGSGTDIREKLQLWKTLLLVNRKFNQIFSTGLFTQLLIHFCKEQDFVNKALVNKPVLFMYELLKFYQFDQILKIGNREDKILLISCYLLYGNLAKLTEKHSEEIKNLFLSQKKELRDLGDISIFESKKDKPIVTNSISNIKNFFGLSICFTGNSFCQEATVYNAKIIFQEACSLNANLFRECKIQATQITSSGTEFQDSIVEVDTFKQIGSQSVFKNCFISISNLLNNTAPLQKSTTEFCNCTLVIETGENESELVAETIIMRNSYIICGDAVLLEFIKKQKIMLSDNADDHGFVELINSKIFTTSHELFAPYILFQVSEEIIEDKIQMLFLIPHPSKTDSKKIILANTAMSLDKVWRLLKMLESEKENTSEIFVSNDALFKSQANSSNSNNNKLTQLQLKCICLIGFQIIKNVYEANIPDREKCELLEKISKLSFFDELGNIKSESLMQLFKPPHPTVFFLKTLADAMQVMFRSHIEKLEKNQMVGPISGSSTTEKLANTGEHGELKKYSAP